MVFFSYDSDLPSRSKLLPSSQAQAYQSTSTRTASSTSCRVRHTLLTRDDSRDLVVVDNLSRFFFFFLVECNRVCLQPIRAVEGSDYINASFIDVSLAFIIISCLSG